MKNYSGKPEELSSSEHLFPGDCYVHLLLLICFQSFVVWFEESGKWLPTLLQLVESLIMVASFHSDIFPGFRNTLSSLFLSLHKSLDFISGK